LHKFMVKTRRILGTIIMLSIFLVVNTALSAGEAITIHIDGKAIKTDVPPVIIKDRTMVPIRVISEELGQEVSWDAVHRRVVITTPGFSSDLPPAEKSARGVSIVIDGQEIKAGPEEPEPFIYNDRTMVPLRIIAEGLNMLVDWEEDTRQVIITKSVKEEEVIDPFPENDLPNSDETATVGNLDFQVAIMGNALMGKEQLLAVLQKNNPAAPKELVDLYLTIGEEYGIRGDIAFCQAAKETGWWKYGGLVQPYQNNYCGLGATGVAATGEEELFGADPTRVRYEAGVHGAIFDTPATGVEAHIQHLYAYAVKAELPVGKILVDPRFIKPVRGSAPLWIDLGGKWAFPGFDRNKYACLDDAFAQSDTYGHSILRDYYQKVLDLANK
jgi:hypothetical protein